MEICYSARANIFTIFSLQCFEFFSNIKDYKINYEFSEIFYTYEIYKVNVCSKTAKNWKKLEFTNQ